MTGGGMRTYVPEFPFNVSIFVARLTCNAFIFICKIYGSKFHTNNYFPKVTQTKTSEKFLLPSPILQWSKNMNFD